MDRPIDVSPLLTAPSEDDVARYRRVTRAARRPAESARLLPMVTAAVGGALLLAVTAYMVGTAVLTLVGIGSRRVDPGELIGMVVSLAAPVIMIVLVIRAVWQRRVQWALRYRMDAFGRANGLQYHSAGPAPAYPGAIFGIGASRRVTDHFITSTPRFVNFGNYAYTTGSGKSRTTHRWGFLAVHLDRALPHMVLDSRANNGLLGGTNLPAVFSRSQVLSLEGDFDRFFTLYCPEEYERDALYVFTPDLMALLVDEAAPYDVEIVDRWMLVYSASPFPLADPTIYRRLLRIVATVGEKTLAQTDRYHDDRIAGFDANIVAPPGRRLRRGFSWVGAAVILVFVAIWVLGTASSVLQ